MKKILFGIALIAVVLGLSACQEKEYPSNPTLTAPIRGLIISVNGEDYTATPQLQEDGSVSDTYILPVKIPNQAAVIKELYLANNYTADIKSGDNVLFVDNLLPVTLTKGGKTASYFIEMSFNPPPFMYFIRSSDTDADGNKYFLNETTADRIASGAYDSHFEGYVDLTTSNWDNIGLITSDKSKYYDYAGGPWPAVSYYAWTGAEKEAAGWGYFSCDGPWNDWLVTNGNPDILSPGVWKINYDSETHAVEMVEVQWAVSGNALPAKTAMTYDAADKTWKLTTTLSPGNFLFTTLPVTLGDPTTTYGLSNGISQLAEGGTAIAVSEAGTYTIGLKLSNPPYYTYTISK